LTYVLKHGQVDEIALIRSAPRNEQHLYQNALNNGFGSGLLKLGPQGVSRPPVIINPDLIEALTFHLLKRSAEG
jgi:hypothetical protein